MAYGVKIKCLHISDEEFAKTLIAFANSTENYIYQAEMSRCYTIGIDSPSFIISYEDKLGCVGYAITKIDNNYSLENIVPRESGCITYDVAEKYAKTFVHDLCRFLKVINCERIAVSLSPKRQLKLDDIITGRKTRKYFSMYVNGYPLSYHPSDVQKLDVFICASYRYSRKQPDCDLLRVYLCDKMKWPEKDAEWCCDRITTGLAILKVNKMF